MRLPLALSVAGLAAVLLPAGGFGATVEADLSARISGPQDGQVGETLVYALELRNAGPAAADAVTARVNVPGTFTKVSVTLTRGGCAADAGGYACTVGLVPAGETVTGSLTVQLVSRQTTVLGFSANSPTADPNPNNGSAALFFLPPPTPRPEPPPPSGPGFPQVWGVVPPAMVGRLYTAQIPFAGGKPPYRILLGGLCGPSNPDVSNVGVTESGVLSFMPRAAGELCVAVRIFDTSEPGREWPGGNARVRIVDALGVASAPDGLTGTRYDAPLIGGGQVPYKTSVRGLLPPGIRVSDGGRRLAGMPVVSGLYRFTVSTQDSLGFAVEQEHWMRIRVGKGRALLANSQLTPGRASGAARCGEAARTSSAQPPVRERLLEAYGVWWRPQLYVLDHLIPVELGGHPTAVLNLWPQLSTRSAATDRLERHLARKVCAGTLSLRAARARIMRHKRNVG